MEQQDPMQLEYSIELIDQSKLILYTGGTFDLFHSGHAKFLKQCKQLVGDDGLVVVSLNTDDFVRRYKKSPPIHSYNDRYAILKSCRYVDHVVCNWGDENSVIVIEAVNPDIIAIGTDWAQKDYYSQMRFTQEWLDERGMLLVYLPYTQGVSTTGIKKLILGNTPTKYPTRPEYSDEVILG